MDMFNQEFHVIHRAEDTLDFKRSYINSYYNIFKGVNQTPIESSLKYDKVKQLNKTMFNNGSIQIKFVKEILTNTNYIDPSINM